MGIRNKMGGEGRGAQKTFFECCRRKGQELRAKDNVFISSQPARPLTCSTQRPSGSAVPRPRPSSKRRDSVPIAPAGGGTVERRPHVPHRDEVSNCQDRLDGMSPHCPNSGTAGSQVTVGGAKMGSSQKPKSTK